MCRLHGERCLIAGVGKPYEALMIDRSNRGELSKVVQSLSSERNADSGSTAHERFHLQLDASRRRPLGC